MYENESYRNEIREKLYSLIPKNARVALFDFPNYPNVGDSAIWLGTRRYIRERDDIKIIESDDNSLTKKKVPKLDPSTIIIILGGGNLGDLWPQHQRLREKVIRSYIDHRIVQLPQSIYFVSENNYNAFVEIAKEHSDLHLLVRDSASLEMAGQMPLRQTVSLCPDMAFMLSEMKTFTPSLDLFILLRSDRESLHEGISMTSIHHGYTVDIGDWLDEPYEITDKAIRYINSLESRSHGVFRLPAHLRLGTYDRLAGKRLSRGCEILSKGRCVITDRLHGHILCLLLGVPHVVLDNRYGKLSSFRKTWGTENQFSLTAESLQDAITKARTLVMN